LIDVVVEKLLRPKQNKLLHSLSETLNLLIVSRLEMLHDKTWLCTRYSLGVFS